MSLSMLTLLAGTLFKAACAQNDVEPRVGERDNCPTRAITGQDEHPKGRVGEAEDEHVARASSEEQSICQRGPW